MSATIRLTRMGKKKRPFYRLVVLDSRKRRDGAYLANLGYYNPFVEPPAVELHADAIVDWLGKGAEVSDSARALLRREGVLHRFALVRQGLPADQVAEQMTAWQQGAEAREERQEQDRQHRLELIAAAEGKRREAEAEAKSVAAAAEGGAGESAESDATDPSAGDDSATGESDAS